MATTTGLTWIVKPEDAFRGLADEYIATIRQSVRALANRYAVEIEAYMKQEALWTDRTSNARQTLTAVVDDIAMDMIEIVLAHGMDYGIWLELANHGRFAIIAPTIDVFAPRIWADIQEMMR